MRARAGQIVFGPFCLDTQSPRLLRDGVNVELRPQALYALGTLARNSGRCVDYEEMIREAWHGISVSRHTVAVTVGEVKKALREYGSWISYHSGFGYGLTPELRADRTQGLNIFERKFAQAEAELLQAKRDASSGKFVGDLTGQSGLWLRKR